MRKAPKIIAFPSTERAHPSAGPRAYEVSLIRTGAPLLSGLDMALSGQGISALVGPNGAGKSVLLRAMAGLITPDTGRIDLPPGMAGRVGLVFQRPVLLRRSVRGNLLHALHLARVPRRQRAERLAELLGLGGLTHLSDRPARRLSGGEAQRLGIVRALAQQPALLLLDEPTAHLDPGATLAIEALMTRIVAQGTKLVIVSHDAGQIARLADEVAFLHRGRCTEVTAMPDFLTAPQSPEAQAYLDGTILL